MKTIHRLRLQNDSITEDPVEILNEMKNYYKILYTRVETKKHEEFFNDLWGPKFEDNHKDRTNNEITEEEILIVLKNTAKNKAPGEDGLPSEFYKVFWIDIKRYLIKSYQHSYSTGILSITQRRGVISLIPKKKDPLNLKNWRPISLLNQDYKLLAKLIAERIKHNLKKLINIDQTGFIKGRYI